MIEFSSYTECCSKSRVTGESKELLQLLIILPSNVWRQTDKETYPGKVTISALKKINYQREEGGWQRKALPYFTVSMRYKEINNAQNNNNKKLHYEEKVE